MERAQAPSPSELPGRGESVTPPARLFRLHERDRISVLVVGGTAARRLQVAHVFHRRSRLARGPLVCLHAARDEAALKGALHAWMSATESRATDPIATAELGTLYIDSIAHLSPAVQRLLLEFSSRHLNASEADFSRPWTGRLIAGDSHRLRAAVRAGAFSMALYDALDKVSIELPAHSPPSVVRRLTA